jgi:hypothetical protein
MVSNVYNVGGIVKLLHTLQDIYKKSGTNQLNGMVRVAVCSWLLAAALFEGHPWLWRRSVATSSAQMTLTKPG